MRKCQEHPGWNEEDCVWCNGANEQYNIVARDQLYNFNWRYKKEVHQVRSKRDFKRLCKERGLTPITKDDVLRNGEPYKPKMPSIPKEHLRGVASEIRRSMTPERIERVWNERKWR